MRHWLDGKSEGWDRTAGMRQAFWTGGAVGLGVGLVVASVLLSLAV